LRGRQPKERHEKVILWKMFPGCIPQEINLYTIFYVYLSLCNDILTL